MTIPRVTLQNLKMFLTVRAVDIDNMRGKMFDFERAIEAAGKSTPEHDDRVLRFKLARQHMFNAWQELIIAQAALNGAEKLK